MKKDKKIIEELIEWGRTRNWKKSFWTREPYCILTLTDFKELKNRIDVFVYGDKRK